MLNESARHARSARLPRGRTVGPHFILACPYSYHAKRKMAKKQILWLFGIGLAILLALTLCLKFPQDSSAWASWYSAIGTVGAVFAAIWATFSAEERQQEAENRRREEAVDSALITSVMMISTVTHMLEELKRALVDLEKIQVDGEVTSVLTVSAVCRRLQNLPKPTEEQLHLLSHAPGDMAVEIAQALVSANFAARLLSPEGLKDTGYIESARPQEGARRAVDPTSNAMRKLQSASQGILDFQESRGKGAKPTH